MFGVDWSAKAFSHCVFEILEGEMLSARLFEVVKHMLKDTLYHSIEEADAYLDQVMKTEIAKESRKKR